MKRKRAWFFMYFCDDDAKTFNVEGPFPVDMDGTAIDKSTMGLRERGRNVRTHAGKWYSDSRNIPTLASVIAEGLEGYKCDPKLRW